MIIDIQTSPVIPNINSKYSPNIVPINVSPIPGNPKYFKGFFSTANLNNVAIKSAPCSKADFFEVTPKPLYLTDIGTSVNLIPFFEANTSCSPSIPYPFS